MQLPIDISELLKISTDLKEVSKTPISVSVYIDDSANDKLIGHVRAAFASAGVHTRVTIGYMDSIPVQINDADDMVVLVVGTGDYIGRRASGIRDDRIPVMVVTDDPEAVAERAQHAGYPIPAADIITPEKIGHKNPIFGAAQSSLDFVKRRFSKKGDEPASEEILRIESVHDGESNIAPDEAAAFSEDMASSANATTKPIELTDETLGYLDDRMGEWILAACFDKKLAMALSFPFVRRPMAYDSVVSTSMQNAAVGFVPLIPGADLPIMTLNQAKMILQIAAAYDQPLDAARIKEIAAVVAGGFMFRNIARSMSRLIPGAGWIISGATGFIGTEAMGRAAIEYFEAGGDIMGVAKVVQEAKDEVIDATKKAASTSAGKKLINVAKSGFGSAYRMVRNR